MHCPIEATLSAIGGKWKLMIVWYLSQRIHRYNELLRSIHGITPKMLTQQLRELEKDEIVQRKVFPVVPPKVEYSLTEAGTALLPVMEQLQKWGETYKSALDTASAGALGIESSSDAASASTDHSSSSASSTTVLVVTA